MQENKFIETIELDDWEIETDSGWKDVTHIHKTIEYDIWEIKTKDFFLKCADTHIVISENREEVFVKDLKIGDKIITKNGIQDILEVIKYDEKDNMYDITVDSEEHTYFTNGILSHNTTVSSIFFLHQTLFSETDMTTAILANKEATAVEILSRIKVAFQELPLWLQQGIDEDHGGWNKKSIGLENGVRIIAGSTASSTIRGYTIKLLLLDEYAHVPENVVDEFTKSAYPTIASGKTSKIIICSTPNGLNSFYNIWRGAVRDENNYYPIRINWNQIPGRTETWKEQTIRDIGIQKFQQEFNCVFLGSTNTLIDGSFLERLDPKIPIELKMGSYLNIYEAPIKDQMYILGVDSSKGVAKDYSAIQVLKINSEHDIDQVALYRNNQIEPKDFAQVIISVSEYYNGCYIMVENNDVGEIVANEIWYGYDYDKILNCDKKGIGIRSTKKSKLAGNMLLKRYAENGWLGIVDKHTIYELSRYEEVRPNIFRCPDKVNDDCVTSLIWALYFVTTTFFDGKNVDIKKIDEKFLLDPETKEEEGEAPIMFDEDGNNTSNLDLKEGWGLEGDFDDNDPGYGGFVF